MTQLVALSLWWISATAQAQEAPSEVPAFERYSYVLLKAGPAEIAEDRAAELGKAHRSHLTEMEKQGKMILAGPFDQQADKSLRGFCLYDTSLVEAKQLASADPAVKAGSLTVEVMDWWVPAGKVVFPAFEKAHGKPSAE